MQRVLGKYPGSGEDVVLHHGRFGPYIRCGEGPTATTAAIGWYPPAAIDLAIALNLLMETQSSDGLKGEPPKWMLNFHSEDFLRADEEFRRRICSDRERLVAAIVAIGAKEKVDDSDADKFALVHFDSEIADTHPAWWHTICAPMSDDQVVQLFKGLVVCERENDWGICSPTPTARVFHILRVRVPVSLFGELRDWALRNRGRNPYTPTGEAIHTSDAGTMRDIILGA